MASGHETHSAEPQVSGRGGRGARWSARLLCLGAVSTALLGWVFSQASGAAGLGFSFTPSKTEPYAVCGRPTPDHAECLAILVPSSSLLSSPSVLRQASPANVSPSFSGSGVGGGFDPADLRSAYDLPSATAGSGQTVAIVDAFDDPKAESDLATYRSRYGISACTTANGCFRKVNQTGGTSYPEGNGSWAVEISLDLDMASAACPNCHILLVEATSNENGNLYAAEDEAAALGATEISNSWGGAEASGEASEDPVFHHAGVLVTASAGDAGYEVEYPAASQYVIAVGGTALSPASNARGWTETAWNGTGSGCSAYEPKPAWQTDPDCSHRTNNDIAAVASQETPVSVADSYELPSEFSKPEAGWTLVAGTSVSSPFIAGTMALANAYTKSFTGADALYLEASQSGTGVLDDVTSGNNVKKKSKSCGNYLCEAGPGYDGPTGLGSPYGAPVVLPSPPTVTTKAASSVTASTATLNATVDPNDGEVSKCEFEYATSEYYEAHGKAYGSSAPCSALPGSGSSAVAVSASVGALAANTTYHFRISATNAGGASKGSDETFKTLANLSVNTSSLPAGELGTPYAQAVAAGGGTTPYTWSLAGGALPAGLHLAENGAITGTPSTAGASSFSVRVTDSSTPTPLTATANLSITVTEATYAASVTGYEFEGEELKFSEPSAVAVDSSGDIWVADSTADRVVEFNAKREYLRQVGSEGSGEAQFRGIGGIATNAAKDLYVVDSGNARVEEFSPAGQQIQTFGSLGTGEGQFITPSAIAVDSSGDVWVLDSDGIHQVEEFSPEGKYITGIGTGGPGQGPLLSPTGLASSGGNLYATEDGLERVVELSSTGQMLGVFGSRGSGNGEFFKPSAIAADPATGNLYITELGSLTARFVTSPASFVFEPSNNRVQELGPEGAFIAAYGSTGPGAGEFSSPKGVAVSSAGELVVADTGNKRVQEWPQAP